MSKSTAKYITVGWACGSNTEYYRERTKIKRAKNKMRLRVALKDGKFIGPPMLKMANDILSKHTLTLNI
jgi:hypothetical protein